MGKVIVWSRCFWCRCCVCTYSSFFMFFFTLSLSFGIGIMCVCFVHSIRTWIYANKRQQTIFSRSTSDFYRYTIIIIVIKIQTTTVWLTEWTIKQLANMSPSIVALCKKKTTRNYRNYTASAGAHTSKLATTFCVLQLFCFSFSRCRLALLLLFGVLNIKWIRKKKCGRKSGCSTIYGRTTSTNLNHKSRFFSLLQLVVFFCTSSAATKW